MSLSFSPRMNYNLAAQQQATIGVVAPSLTPDELQ